MKEVSDYVKSICRIGAGALCCKYLVMGTEGFECMRVSSAKSTIDALWKVGNHVAISDNCDGVSDPGLLRTEDKAKYIVFSYRGRPAILCTTCGKISYNENDAKYLWCERCKTFHSYV